MRQNLLAKTSYDNTVAQWATALGIILETQTAMNTEILSRFNAEGLEFAFPTQTLFTKKMD